MLTLSEQIDAVIDSWEGRIELRYMGLANASALIYSAFRSLNWAGFYLMDNNELLLGPFQGKIACTHIPLGRGVCGTAAYEKRSIIVDDVHTFDGHIACDGASNSEIVVPLMDDGGEVLGLIDIDSTEFSNFTEENRIELEKTAKLLVKKLFLY